MFSRWLRYLALFCSVCLPAARAQAWTVQVFAYRDDARAAEIAARLRDFGFDAYSERAPESAFAQVRVGCFLAQEDAEGLLQDVRQRVAQDALVAPLSAGAPVTACVERNVGFIVPSSGWGVAAADDTAVTFWVEAAGRRFITFDGDWQLAQDGAELARLERALEAPAPLAARYRATKSRDLPLVRAELRGGSLLIGAGELLWHSAEAAVVRADGTVVALSLRRP